MLVSSVRLHVGRRENRIFVNAEYAIRERTREYCRFSLNSQASTTETQTVLVKINGMLCYDQIKVILNARSFQGKQLFSCVIITRYVIV